MDRCPLPPRPAAHGTRRYGRGAREGADRSSPAPRRPRHTSCYTGISARHGPWQSVSKLQLHFGLDKKPDVNKASFRAAFAAAAEKGLDPSDFEYRFRSSTAKIKAATSGWPAPTMEEGAADTLAPLVLIHGWLDSGKTWDRVAPTLEAAGRRVIAITLRGWGDAAEADGAFTIEAYAADVVAVLDAHAIDKAVLVGHSMGTIVASAVAVRAPERVAGLALCGAAATMQRERILDPSDGTTCADVGVLCQGWATAGSPDQAVLKDFQLGDLTGKVPQAFADQVMAETLKANVRAFGEAWCSMLDHDHTAELAELVLPVLLVWGTLDTVFPAVDQAALDAALSAASVTRVEVEGAPHAVLWTHADETASAIVSFLEASAC